MATALKYQTEYDMENIPSAESMKFGVVVAEWNGTITERLGDGAINMLKHLGAQEANIKKIYVPGSFELVGGCKMVAQYAGVDAVIAIGAVIQGETKHFKYVCQGVTQGITDLNSQGEIPVIFGVLTTEDFEQAFERAGGKLGNKGEDCAIAAVKMVALKRELSGK